MEQNTAQRMVAVRGSEMTRGACTQGITKEKERKHDGGQQALGFLTTCCFEELPLSPICSLSSHPLNVLHRFLLIGLLLSRRCPFNRI